MDFPVKSLAPSENRFAAKLEILKAEAKTAKADFEMKAITELIAKQREILDKLRQPRKQ